MEFYLIDFVFIGWLCVSLCIVIFSFIKNKDFSRFNFFIYIGLLLFSLIIADISDYIYQHTFRNYLDWPEPFIFDDNTFNLDIDMEAINKMGNDEAYAKEVIDKWSDWAIKVNIVNKKYYNFCYIFTFILFLIILLFVSFLYKYKLLFCDISEKDIKKYKNNNSKKCIR